MVGFHRDLARQLARPENLETVAQLVDDTQFQEAVGGERVAFERFQLRQVDDSEVLLENVLESALGKPPVERT